MIDYNEKPNSIRVNETTTLNEMKKIIKQKLGNLKQKCCGLIFLRYISSKSKKQF